MSARAFDLVPAIERISHGDKFSASIESLECSEDNLYIGTKDSHILHYHLRDETLADGSTKFYSNRRNQINLGFKKGVQLMKAAPLLKQLLTLCEGCLTILNMLTLEVLPSLTKLKGITYFCLNENPTTNNPFILELCVAKKKQIQLYNLTEDKLIHIKDISISEVPLLMCMDGYWICVATSTRYLALNTASGTFQDLYSLEADHTPVVKRITREEFLITGPSGLGVFVKVSGISDRPPLLWGEGIVSVAYSHPYIIVLSTQFLSIYNILDNQVKQSIPFSGGSCLDNFDGKILVTSTNVICALLPIPWDKQIQSLLLDKQVDEALELVKYASKSTLPKEQTDMLVRRVYQQAGFAKLFEGNLAQAQDLFIQSSLDPREVICLYPNLLLPTSNFTRTFPPLHELASIGELDGGANYKQFLFSYLEAVRDPSSPYVVEIDTALLKLHVELNSVKDRLISFLENPNTKCDLKETTEFLTNHNLHHALATYLYNLGKYEQALSIWLKLLMGEYKDSLFEGLPFFVKILANLPEPALIWKYMDKLLAMDQIKAVDVFTKRPNADLENDHLKPEVVVDFLHHYPLAQIKYLEYLIRDKKLEKEKYHTHLAVLLIDRVIRIMSSKPFDEELLRQERSKLQKFLLDSNLYRIHLVLGKAKDNKLHMECSILYGKLEEHEKALRVLVHDLGDHQAAKDYCITISRRSGRSSQPFHTLLSVYLDKDLDPGTSKAMLEPALELLNSEFADFDAIKILELLPPSWSLQTVSRFLNKSLRSTYHRKTMSRIQRGLCHGDLLQVKLTHILLQRTSIILDDNSVCSSCHGPFFEPDFVRLPSGNVLHTKCHLATTSSTRSSPKWNNPFSSPAR